MKFWRIPLDRELIVIPRGDVSVITARCKGCGYCENFCPRQVLTLSEEINTKGYHYPKVTRADSCVACGLCQIMCPEFAIYVTERKNGS